MAKNSAGKSDKRATHQVDYEIEWKNFRGFQGTGTVVFRPLTILIGANNVGKTSLTAPLLLLSQTMSSRDTVTPLVTRGSLIDSGIFRHNVHRQEVERNIELTLRYHVHHHHKKSISKVGSYPPGALRIVLGRGSEHEDVLLKEFHINDIFNRPYISRILQEDGSYTLTGIPLKTLTEQEKAAVEQSRPTNFMFSPNNLLYCYQSAADSEDDEPSTATRRSMTKDFSHYLQVTAYSYEQVRSFLLGTTYIGPLRERPRRHYQLDSEVPRAVGPRGERTANLLRRKIQDKDFKSKLDGWIRRFEFGDSLFIDRETPDIFSISFKRSNPDRKINIADSGFGASQVLPLIVQALAAREGTLTIAEQPEIHLNPRLQTVLADLFAEMANTSHRIVVETHSEHLLLRLRRLIAEGKIESKKVAVYFVENDKDGSSVRSIALEDNGNIPSESWPRGFFAETLQESLALATAQSKLVRKPSKPRQSGARSNAN